MLYPVAAFKASRHPELPVEGSFNVTRLIIRGEKQVKEAPFSQIQCLLQKRGE